VDPLHDPRCLVTAEALFLDGANGVCGTPRQGAGQSAPLASSLLFVVVFAVALTLRLRTSAGGARRMRLHVLGAAALVLAALPGLWAIATERADGPAAASTTAFGVRRAHDQVHAFATAHGGATLRTETEISIVPIARLALAGVTGDGTAPVDLFDDTLEDGCREIEGTLTCGTPPSPSAPPPAVPP
jgi:hypothetical protein